MKLYPGLNSGLQNVGIGTKLMLAFFLVLSLTLLLGGFSIVKLAQVNQVSSDLALKWMPSVGHTTTMRSAMLEFRDLEVKHTRAADVGYMEEYEEKMKAALAIVTQESSGYEKMIEGEEGKQLFGKFSKTWAEYLVVNKKVIDLGRANKPDDAKDIGEGAAKSLSDDAIVALDKLTALNFAGGKAAADHANGVYVSARLWTFGLLGGAVLIGLVMSLIITRGLLKQLGGEPAYATSLTTEIAEGKLYMDIALKDGDSQSLLAGIRDMRDSIARMVKEVRSRADGIAVASSEIDQGNTNLSSRTEQQASALQQTAASMQQLNDTVKQNAEGARQASQLALSASAVAAKGGEVVAQVVDTMKGINDSSKKITDIIGVIDSIAFQTNILALNAAVEAARAGEQGRGFAVVASEVRSLAGRSAEAAKEIKNLVGASVQRVAQGTALVDQAGSTMTEVVDSIRRVTELMGEISAASNEQSQEVARVGVSIAQMDDVTQQNAALVEQMAAAATSLSSQAQELVGAAAIFILNQADAHAAQASAQGVSEPVVLAHRVETRSQPRQPMQLLRA
jgi:methyl-accepting chemotaxis protein